MKIAILGATSGMGRSLARLAAARGHQVVVMGRNAAELERSVADLQVRHQAQASAVTCDLDEPAGFANALNLCRQAHGGSRLDVVVVTAARFGTQDQLEKDEALLAQVLNTNFTATILFCEQARRLLLEQGGGTLCVFSSVAGDRGRKPIALYGSTKAGLSHYLESLDHRHHADGLRVVTVKPGFVHTSMTSGLKPPPFAGQPDQVAADVLRAIERGTPVVYTPAMWRLVMLVIRNLPRFVMRKVGF
jgi:short-subunit dehydrogenase